MPADALLELQCHELLAAGRWASTPGLPGLARIDHPGNGGWNPLCCNWLFCCAPPWSGATPAARQHLGWRRRLMGWLIDLAAHTQLAFPVFDQALKERERFGDALRSGIGCWSRPQTTLRHRKTTERDRALEIRETEAAIADKREIRDEKTRHRSHLTAACRGGPWPRMEMRESITGWVPGP